MLTVRLDLGLLTTSYPKPASGAKLYLALRRDGNALKLALSGRDISASNLSRVYMTAYPAMMAGILMPAIVRARRQAQSSSSRNNLHQIGLGLAMYAAENNGNLPPNLQVLVEDGYVVSPNVFIDPADGDPQVRGTKGYKYSYDFVGPLPADMPSSFIVAYSRQGVQPGGRNVLYVDGAVQFLSEEALHTDGGGRGYSLQQQYQWLMESHGSEYTDEQKAAFRKFYEVGQPAQTSSAPAAAPPAAAPLRALTARTRADIATLRIALNTFLIDTGRYPTTAEGLRALVEPPAGLPNWRGPYMQRPAPADPWGRPYVYVCPGVHNPDGFDLSSMGPDGREGGGDDMDNWSDSM